MKIQSKMRGVLGALALLCLGGCGREAEQKPASAPAAKPAVDVPAPVVEKPALSATAERMADQEYLKAMQAVNERRTAVSEQAKTIGKRMEERVAALAAESESVRTANEKLAALRKSIAEAEAEVAEQEKALRALVAEDASWKALSDEMNTIAAKRDALSKEMQDVIQQRMQEQAGKRPAPQLPGTAPGN